jgi:ubiquinone/menaquinone biosynthesis C-methylase UbiE
MPTIDFGRHSDDYARHRPGFPASFYDRLATFFDANGMRAVDIATGPGVVALELARRGATVTGLDIAQGQIDAAIRRAESAGLSDRTSFVCCRAEHHRTTPASVDLVTAGQCWRWFDADAMLPIILSWLRPGGWLVIAHFDYNAHRSDIARRTEDLVLQYNPGWTLAGKDGLYPEYIDQVIRNGFDFIEQFCYDHLQSFSHESWRGRMRTCNGVGSGGMPEETVEVFDRELAALLEREFGREPLNVWHRIWAVIARAPERGP